jgi:NADPH:quinone reductase-like Zn-dependent oxidoreductase
VGKISFWHCRRALKKRGRFVSTDFGPRGQVPLLAVPTAVTSRLGGGRRVSLPLPRYKKTDVLYLKSLIEAGQYRAVVDRVYPLEEIVDATKYVETEQKTGNVVIRVAGAGS